jgi:hypothetical protein
MLAASGNGSRPAKLLAILHRRGICGGSGEGVAAITFTSNDKWGPGTETLAVSSP